MSPQAYPAHLGRILVFGKNRCDKKNGDCQATERVEDERLHRSSIRNIITPLDEKSKVIREEVSDQKADLDPMPQKEREQAGDEEKDLPDRDKLIKNSQLKQVFYVEHACFHHDSNPFLTPSVKMGTSGASETKLPKDMPRAASLCL